MLSWTESVPTEEGMYVYKKFTEWPVRIAEVRRGNWKLCQDPEKLYYSTHEQVHQMHGVWLGPLPPVNLNR
jgi:hypothetical protein